MWLVLQRRSMNGALEDSVAEVSVVDALDEEEYGFLFGIRLAGRNPKPGLCFNMFNSDYANVCIWNTSQFLHHVFHHSSPQCYNCQLIRNPGGRLRLGRHLLGAGRRHEDPRRRDPAACRGCPPRGRLEHRLPHPPGGGAGRRQGAVGLQDPRSGRGGGHGGSCSCGYVGNVVTILPSRNTCVFSAEFGRPPACVV